MYRTIMEALIAWKNSLYRKPLLLEGVRQVGKTYTLLQFGREQYDTVAYFNFETSPQLSEAFDGDISAAHLIGLLSHLGRTTIVRERTLIILDEIQVCERALTALKYFHEQANDYHIIAAGSLLGVAINRSRFSFPVGSVSILNMYPMDYEEFLLALGEGELVNEIRRCYGAMQAMPPILHTKALERYRQYLAVGGMPECVKHFAATSDYVLVRQTQAELLVGYQRDMAKYNTKGEAIKAALIYENITAQLSKVNTRFQYKLLKQGARASLFEDAIQWLILSGVIARVHRLEHLKIPLSNYIDIDAFKMYGADVGLLNAMKQLLVTDLLYDSETLSSFKGGLAENYVNGQLVARGYETFYWESARMAEVDFIIHQDGKIIPIEVKAADNTRSKSLTIFMDTYQSDHGIKLGTKNFGTSGKVSTIPLYAAFCI